MRHLVSLFAILALIGTAQAQQSSSSSAPAMQGTSQQATSATLPHSAPVPAYNHEEDLFTGAYSYLYRGSVGCGVGAAYTVQDKKPTINCGFGITAFPWLVTEFGAMGPAFNRDNATAYLSEDVTVPLLTPLRFNHLTHGYPIALAGYTRMFETGRNSLDYGTGIERRIDEKHTLQFELRDYWTFADPHQHNVVFRLVWVTGIDD
jgi:hypothetical protein